jgi:VWFA-related protein
VLDTVVTDRKGSPVSGLTRDEFRVFQDGVEQTIRHFEATASASSQRGQVAEVPTVLVLDELNTPFEETVYSHDQVHRFLAQQGPKLANPTMLLYIDDRGFHPLGSYTHDRALLIHELDGHKTGLPSKLMRGANDEMIALSLSLLQQIAIATRGESGRKLLLWVGRGFPGFDPQELPSDQQELVETLVADTSNLLAESRITVSKIDPTIANPSLSPSDIQDAEDSVESLAASQEPLESNINFNTFVKRTGGQFLFGRNDLDREIAHYVADESVYYTLTYVPRSSPAEDKYHSIRIVMRRPELHARTRDRFYPDTPQKPNPDAKTLGADLHEAAVSGIHYSGLGVQISSCERHSTGLLCHVKVDLANLRGERSSNGDYRVSVVAVFVALNKQGKIATFKAERITELIPASDKRPLNVGSIDLPLEIEVLSPSQSARVVVRDNAGRIGTADLSEEQLEPLRVKTGSSPP